MFWDISVLPSRSIRSPSLLNQDSYKADSAATNKAKPFIYDNGTYVTCRPLLQRSGLTNRYWPARSLSVKAPAQIVSRLRRSVELAEHFVHGVDDRLRLIQLNLVT